MSWPSDELEDLFIFEDGMLLKWWSAFVKACNQREAVLGITKTKFYCTDGTEKDDATEDDFLDMFAPDYERLFTENVDRLIIAIGRMCTSPYTGFAREPSGKPYLAKVNLDYDETAKVMSQSTWSFDLQMYISTQAQSELAALLATNKVRTSAVTVSNDAKSAAANAVLAAQYATTAANRPSTSVEGVDLDAAHMNSAITAIRNITNRITTEAAAVDADADAADTAAAGDIKAEHVVFVTSTAAEARNAAEASRDAADVALDVAYQVESASALITEFKTLPDGDTTSPISMAIVTAITAATTAAAVTKAIEASEKADEAVVKFTDQATSNTDATLVDALKLAVKDAQAAARKARSAVETANDIADEAAQTAATYAGVSSETEDAAARITEMVNTAIAIADAATARAIAATDAAGAAREAADAAVAAAALYTAAMKVLANGSGLPYIPATPPSFSGIGTNLASLDFWTRIRDFFDEAKYVGLAIAPKKVVHKWTMGLWLLRRIQVSRFVWAIGGWLTSEVGELEPYDMSFNAREFFPLVWEARHRIPKQTTLELGPYTGINQMRWSARYDLGGPAWAYYPGHWEVIGGSYIFTGAGWSLWGGNYGGYQQYEQSGSMGASESEFVKSTYDTTPLADCGNYIGTWCYVELVGGPKKLDGQLELVSGTHGGVETTLTYEDVLTDWRVSERMDISEAVVANSASNEVETRIHVPEGDAPWTTNGVYNVKLIMVNPRQYRQEPESGEHPTGGGASITGRDIFVFCDPGDMIEN